MDGNYGEIELNNRFSYSQRSSKYTALTIRRIAYVYDKRL